MISHGCIVKLKRLIAGWPSTLSHPAIFVDRHRRFRQSSLAGAQTPVRIRADG
jgi:hypothetical protein